MMYDESMYQELFTNQYTKTLSDVYPEYSDFQSDYENLGIPMRLKDPSFLKTIYVLLMGEYGHSSMAALSEDLFRLRLFTLIMSYGPQYERELDIQNKLLAMSDEELQVSSKAVYNTSLNPSEKPSTDSLEILDTINQQNVTNHIRSKLDAFAFLRDVLDADLTKEFIKRFDHLFVRLLNNIGNQLYYKTEGDLT